MSLRISGHSFKDQFMNRIVFMFVIIFAVSYRYSVHGINPVGLNPATGTADQDTIQKKQILYNGVLWENKYHRIKGDQFLFSDIFLTGTIYIDGKAFRNVRIKYDLYLDELLTPLNLGEILKLNREKVDSFNLTIENKLYRFVNIRNEAVKGFIGYTNVLYEGKTKLYVKYSKKISPSSSSQYDGEFYQSPQTFMIKENAVFQINSPRDLFGILNTKGNQVKDYVKKNKIKVSKSLPESYLPVVRFYDSISQ